MMQDITIGFFLIGWALGMTDAAMSSSAYQDSWDVWDYVMYPIFCGIMLAVIPFVFWIATAVE